MKGDAPKGPMRGQEAERNRPATRSVAIAMAIASAVIALIIIGFVVTAWARRAQGRRAAAVRQRYAERRGACPDVHFEAPLGARFCADATACLPLLDHPHPTAAFGNEPLWSNALEWMADRVGGVVRRRLYWTEARVVHADEVDEPADGRCALVIDLDRASVVATTKRPLRVSPPVTGRLVVVAMLDGQPRALSRLGGHRPK